MSTTERIFFVLSVAVLAYLIGFATRWHGWFPNSLLERASRQATAQVATWSSTPILDDRVYDRSGARAAHPDSMQPGLTLLTSAWPAGDGCEPGLTLDDREGTAVHRWRFDKTTLFPDSLDRRGAPGLPGSTAPTCSRTATCW